MGGETPCSGVQPMSTGWPDEILGLLSSPCACPVPKRALLSTLLAASLLVTATPGPAAAVDVRVDAGADAGASAAAAAAADAREVATKAVAGSKSVFKSVLSGFATNLGESNWILTWSRARPAGGRGVAPA